MSKYLEHNFELTSDQIDKTVLLIESKLKELKIESKQIISIRLSIEDILVSWMQETDSQTQEKAFQDCTLIISKTLGRWKIVFETEGSASNPLTKSDEENLGFDFAGKLCSALNENGLKVEYSRTKESNLVCYYLPRRQINPLFLNIGAIVSAFIFCFLMSFLSKETSSFFVEKIIDPTFNCLLSLLSAVSVFMIFFSILSCICNTSDLSSFGKYGRKTVGTFIKGLFVSTIILTVPMVIFTKTLGSSSINISKVIGDFYITILNIIPENLISPFITKNTLQITFLAVTSGIFILIIGNKANSLIEVINTCNIVIMKAIESLCNLMPVCIFLALSSLTLKGDFLIIQKSAKIFIFLFVLGGLNSLRIIFTCSLKLKVSFFNLLKDSFRTGLTGFITSSSFACLDSLHELTVKKYKVSEKNFSFTFAMNQIFNKTCMLTCCIVEFFIIASIYGIDFSISHIIVISIVNILIAISTPSVPGAGIAAWTSLIATGGLPAEALSIVISVTVFEDMIDTGFHMLSVGPEIIHLDRELKEL